MKLLTTALGDEVYRYDKSIVMFFRGKRKVLSTSIFNGGYHEDFQAVFNNDCTQGQGMPCLMLADTDYEHMVLRSKSLGLEPSKVTGMGTAAQMENAAVHSLSYKELTVTAIVTGGIENNGGRVGDPSDYYHPIPRDLKPGTINIILAINSDMPAGTLTRALVTCTEAKTAALQELVASSKYSHGIATGSGTDQTIIVANSEAELYLEGSGKHSKLGELIGKVVKAAVKEALFKQTGLSALRQHDALRRMERFGVSADGLWQDYLHYAEEHNVSERMLKPNFLMSMNTVMQNYEVVMLTSLYAHLIDQYEWELLEQAEVKKGAEMLLPLLDHEAQIEFDTINTEKLVRAWSEIMLKKVKDFK